jgi:hypothetical protein
MRGPGRRLRAGRRLPCRGCGRGRCCAAARPRRRARIERQRTRTMRQLCVPYFPACVSCRRRVACHICIRARWPRAGLRGPAGRLRGRPPLGGRHVRWGHRRRGAGLRGVWLARACRPRDALKAEALIGDADDVAVAQRRGPHGGQRLGRAVLADERDGVAVARLAAPHTHQLGCGLEFMSGRWRSAGTHAQGAPKINLHSTFLGSSYILRAQDVSWISLL